MTSWLFTYVIGLCIVVFFTIVAAMDPGESVKNKRLAARLFFAAPAWPIFAVAYLAYGLYQLWLLADIRRPPWS